jgi:hypothetical protein
MRRALKLKKKVDVDDLDVYLILIYFWGVVAGG